MLLLLRTAAKFGRSATSRAVVVRSVRFNSNVTYSGGHASEGQGGFYGSGGSRAALTPSAKHRPDAVAHAADVAQLVRVVEEIEKVESLILQEPEGSVTNKSIELKAKRTGRWLHARATATTHSKGPR